MDISERIMGLMSTLDKVSCEWSWKGKKKKK
jgi:hypothetical protein